MQENRNKDFLQSRFFTVGHDPFCAWYVNGTDDALLRGMDTRYFQYLAETHGKNLDGENRQRAAVALRTSYYHGLETLFMLIFAALQSPHCIVAWLSKCEPKQLRKFVGEVTTGELPPIWKWELSKKSWNGISSLIHRRLFAGHDNSIMMQESFARLWEKLAEDYTAQHMVYEYNNFKHGFRASVGSGPTLSFHSPDQAGKVSKENQSLVLASEYGSWFNVAKDLPDVKPHLDHHFKLEHCHVNLNPNMMVSRLSMISISIHNVVAFLRFVNSFPPEDIQFMLPQNAEAFQICLKVPEELGLAFVAMGPTVPVENVTLTKQQIIERLSKIKPVDIPEFEKE